MDQRATAGRTYPGLRCENRGRFQRKTEKLVTRAYPSDVASEILRLWEERERWLVGVVASTLCHQDAFRRNLMSRVAGSSTPQTIAFDWTFIGLAPLDAELAPLVVASTIRL